MGDSAPYTPNQGTRYACFHSATTFQSLLVMLTVALIAFSMFRYVGDPIASMVGQDTTPQQRAQLRVDLGLDDPFVVQFARFVGNAVQGDFGISYRQRRPVAELLEERLPATLELSFVSALMALVFGIPMGIYTALRPRRAVQDVHGALAGGHLAAHVPDRHPADTGVRRAIALAAQLRARRGHLAWMVVHRAAHALGTGGADHAWPSRWRCSR